MRRKWKHESIPIMCCAITRLQSVRVAARNWWPRWRLKYGRHSGSYQERSSNKSILTNPIAIYLRKLQRLFRQIDSSLAIAGLPVYVAQSGLDSVQDREINAILSESGYRNSEIRWDSENLREQAPSFFEQELCAFLERPTLRLLWTRNGRCHAVRWFASSSRLSGSAGFRIFWPTNHTKNANANSNPQPSVLPRFSCGLRGGEFQFHEHNCWAVSPAERMRLRSVPLARRGG